MKNFWWVIPLFLSLQTAFSQEVETVPIQFNQFFNAIALINPSGICTKGKIEVELGTQRNSGVFKHINTSFASANIRIPTKRRSKSFQVVGLSFYNDKEGEYLRRSRIYLNYGWHTKLSSKASLSGGLSLGNFSYSVNTPSVSSADNALDGILGFFIYGPKSYLGLSINQVFNSKLTPIDQTDRLIRHYYLTAGYSYDFSSSLSLSPKMLLRYVPGFPLGVDLATIGIIKGVVSVGGTYRYKKKFSVLLGLERLDIGAGHLKFMFSYSVPAGRKGVGNLRSYELIMNYDFEPIKKMKK